MRRRSVLPLNLMGVHVQSLSGDLVTEGEKTETDRNRQRRLKKKVKHVQRVEREARDKLKDSKQVRGCPSGRLWDADKWWWVQIKESGTSAKARAMKKLQDSAKQGTGVREGWRVDSLFSHDGSLNGGCSGRRLWIPTLRRLAG